VLVVGGQDEGKGASAELYDPAKGTWRTTGSLTAARGLPTATLLPDGTVLVAGGAGSSGVLASPELYDPAKGTWRTTGSLSTARVWHTATLLPDGTVLVAGGRNQGGQLEPFASAEIYDPATGTWRATGSLTTARQNHTATLLSNGTVLVVGGEEGAGGILASAEVYTPPKSP
jgi:N-acetylneuraminic acid mutarotase